MKRLWALLFAVVLLSAYPSGATTLFGLVDTGELFVSHDGGFTWGVRARLPIRDAVSISATDASSHLYLAGRSGIVCRSEDAGLSWDPVGAVTSSDVTDLAVRPDGALLLLTVSGTVYISVNGGTTFDALAALTGSDFASMTATDSSTLYAVTKSGDVVRSETGGANWLTVGTIGVSDEVALRGVGHDLYALTETGDVHRSYDGGASWTPVGALSQVHMKGLTSEGTYLFAATQEGEVAASADGMAWQWRGALGQLSVVALGNDTPRMGGVGPGSVGQYFSLGQNYPNPFQPGTQFTYIPFRLSLQAPVEISIYDALGRLVTTIYRGQLPADDYRLQWDGLDGNGRAVASGVYGVTLRSGGRADEKKVLLVK